MDYRRLQIIPLIAIDIFKDINYSNIMDNNNDNTQDEKKVEQLKDFCQDRVLTKQQEMATFLENVALNPDFRDKRLIKVGDAQLIKEVPISMNVRVAAAKLWKEMFTDKAVGDVKEKAKEKAQRGLDLKKILENLAEEQRKSSKESTDGEEY